MFLSVSLENYLSIFVPSLSFDLSTLNCLYICEGLYLRALPMTA